jgi:heptosyltransferase-2
MGGGSRSSPSSGSWGARSAGRRRECPGSLSTSPEGTLRSYSSAGRWEWNPPQGNNGGVLVRLPSAPRLLVRVPNWLGDAVAAEPLLDHLCELRSRGALGDLAFAGPEHVLPILDHLEAARRLPHAGRGGERPEAWRGHDAALLLTGSFRSAWTAWRAGIPERAGAARDGRGPWLTAAVPVPRESWRLARRPRPEPVGVSYRRLWAAAARRWGLAPLAIERPPRLREPEAVHARVLARLESLGLGAGGAPRVWANVGGRPGSAKAPPADYWVRLLAALAAARPVRLGLLYGPGEAPRTEAVRDGLARVGVTATALWPEAAADLHELVALCSQAAWTLTSDTGPRHVALASGSRTFVLFGSSDPRHTDTHPEREVRWTTSASCAPCGRERCRLSRDRQLACFTEEPLEDQVRALLAGLDGSGGR